MQKVLFSWSHRFFYFGRREGWKIKWVEGKQTFPLKYFFLPFLKDRWFDLSEINPFLFLKETRRNYSHTLFFHGCQLLSRLYPLFSLDFSSRKGLTGIRNWIYGKKRNHKSKSKNEKIFFFIYILKVLYHSIFFLSISMFLLYMVSFKLADIKCDSSKGVP